MSSIPIFVGGTKGGSAKTLTSHLLALGAILHNQPAAYVLTDPKRKMRALGRPYNVIDGRDPAQLATILQASQSSTNGFWFIDGGGNRPAFDIAVAAQCALCVVPFKDTDEDVAPTIESLADIPNSYAWPAAWPTNPLAKADAQQYLDRVSQAFPLRVIQPPIWFINSAKHLLDDQLGNPSTEVRAAARKAFTVLLDWLETHVAAHAKAASQAASELAE